MSHTNKWHILRLIFYSWFLSSLSKCLHLKLKVPFLEKHSTITSLTFQVNVTLTRKPKQFVLTPETELQHPGPESFPGVDA